MKRKLAILAAVFLFSSALAGHGLELTPSAKEAEMFHDGDFVYQRNAMGESVKIEAVWDGRVAAIEPATTLALSR